MKSFEKCKNLFFEILGTIFSNHMVGAQSNSVLELLDKGLKNYKYVWDPCKSNISYLAENNQFQILSSH